MKIKKNNTEKILEKAVAGERLTLEDGVRLYEANLHLLGRAATIKRNKLNDPHRATFVVGRNISYTNACVSGCDFCVFSVDPDAGNVFVLSQGEILEKINESVKMGGTQILLQGGLNPRIDFNFYLQLLKVIKTQFPNVTLHAFSPTEIDFFSNIFNKPVPGILEEFKKAGLDSIPGGGGEILVERVRSKISPNKISASRWMQIEKEIHRAGFKTSATMVIGHIETKEERLTHLLKLRDLQDETGGVRSFIPWTMSTPNTKLSHIKKVAGEDYLRTVAVSRLILDNIPHIQAGWVTEGHKLSQLALAFGADDMGGVLVEEKVLEGTGLSYQTEVEDMKRLIRQAGYVPEQRDTAYRTVKTFGASD